MNLKTFLLFSTLILSPIVFTQTAQANEPQCELTTDCPYGARVSDRWIEGANSEQSGDFNEARASYIKAFDASEKLVFPGKSLERVKLLRACAAQGSYARLAGAIAGAEFMKTHLETREYIKMAVDISRQTFRDVVDQQDIDNPELATKCP